MQTNVGRPHAALTDDAPKVCNLSRTSRYRQSSAHASHDGLHTRRTEGGHCDGRNRDQQLGDE